jgi:hypothetical protein
VAWMTTKLHSMCRSAAMADLRPFSEGFSCTQRLAHSLVHSSFFQQEAIASKTLSFIS